MTYEVVIHRPARNDLRAAYLYAARRAPLAARRWLDRFESALQSLTRFPERCPLAKENSKVDIELREFPFGRKPYVYRTVFTIDGTLVRVLRVRRAQRKFLTQSEIEKALDDDT